MQRRRNVVDMAKRKCKYQNAKWKVTNVRKLKRLNVRTLGDGERYELSNLSNLQTLNRNFALLSLTFAFQLPDMSGHLYLRPGLG